MAIGGIGIAALLATAMLAPAPRLVWNVSTSAPRGLYAVSPSAALRAGDSVIAYVPKPYRRLAAERRYLPMNVPLVKRVVGTAGTEICAAGETVTVDGRLAARRQHADGQGRPLPVWSGCVRLRAGQMFLLMDDPASFDGRYFGVTQQRDVIGKVRLLWRR